MPALATTLPVGSRTVPLSCASVAATWAQARELAMMRKEASRKQAKERSFMNPLPENGPDERPFAFSRQDAGRRAHYPFRYAIFHSPMQMSRIILISKQWEIAVTARHRRHRSVSETPSGSERSILSRRKD